jgi:hypothetical protein
MSQQDQSYGELDRDTGPPGPGTAPRADPGPPAIVPPRRTYPAVPPQPQYQRRPPEPSGEPAPRRRSNGAAVTALVLGLLGLASCTIVITGFVGIGLGGLGLAFGLVGLIRLRHRGNSRILAVAGFLAAALAVALGVVTTVRAVRIVRAALATHTTTQPPAPAADAGWGHRYTWADGLAVEVAAPAPFTPGPSAWDTGVRNVIVTVTLINRTPLGYAYSPFAFGPASPTFDGRPIESITDDRHDVGEPPEAQIPSGGSLTTRWAYGLSAGPGQLRLRFHEHLGSLPVAIAGPA